MGRHLPLGAPASAVLLLVAACGSGDADTTLTVDGMVSICPQNGECADLPAAGATVTVFDKDGSQVDRAVLNSAGHVELTVREGNYRASLSMPSLGLETNADSVPEVFIPEGEHGELSITLPPVVVTPRVP
jgi:hypothetical protein